MKLATIICSICFLYSCVNQNEVQTKEDKTIKENQEYVAIEGRYQANPLKGSEIGLDFAVISEDGLQDIIINLTRSGYTDKERQFWEENDFDYNLIEEHFGHNLELGADYDPSILLTGEAIQTQADTLYKFGVCAPTFQYDENYTITYCLIGDVCIPWKKAVGQLTFRWERTGDQDYAMGSSSLYYMATISQ